MKEWAEIMYKWGTSRKDTVRRTESMNEREIGEEESCSISGKRACGCAGCSVINTGVTATA